MNIDKLLEKKESLIKGIVNGNNELNDVNTQIFNEALKDIKDPHQRAFFTRSMQLGKSGELDINVFIKKTKEVKLEAEKKENDIIYNEILANINKIEDENIKSVLINKLDKEKIKGIDINSFYIEMYNIISNKNK